SFYHTGGVLDDDAAGKPEYLGVRIEMCPLPGGHLIVGLQPYVAGRDHALDVLHAARGIGDDHLVGPDGEAGALDDDTAGEGGLGSTFGDLEAVGSHRHRLGQGGGGSGEAQQQNCKQESHGCCSGAGVAEGSGAAPPGMAGSTTVTSVNCQ